VLSKKHILVYAQAALCVSLVGGSLGGCTSGGGLRDEEQHAAVRNQQLAAELTHEATELMGEDPLAAERLLLRALDADRFHGPAHNNLGVIYLNRGKLYEAAEEFDWARRLMPGHPDPRINLGLALERGGKIDEALDAYASAIEVYPNHLPAMQALARLEVRTGRATDQTMGVLREIVHRGNASWRKWARQQLIRY